MNDRKNQPKRRGRPVAAPDGDMRERLLDAATALFAEQGIAATPMAAIAARVGVTPAMVHYYFKSRDRLLDAVVEERIGRFIAVVEEQVNGWGDDPVGMVRALVARIMQSAQAMPWMPPLWIREIASDGGQLRERLLQRLPFDVQRKFGACITEGQRRGLVNPDLHPYMLFVSIIGLTLFPLAVAKIWKRFPTMERMGYEGLIDHATSLLMSGMAGPGAEPKARRKRGGRGSC